MLKSFALLFWFVLHPVHVTLTSVDYAPKDGCFKVFIKMYFDDFLLDSEQDENDFMKDKNKRKEITENYINKKIIIKTDNKTITGKVNSIETVDDEIKIYMEYKTSRRQEELLVKNFIMTELYNDQSNFMIIKVDKFEEGFKFTPEITEQIFKIGR